MSMVNTIKPRLVRPDVHEDALWADRLATIAHVVATGHASHLVDLLQSMCNTGLHSLCPPDMLPHMARDDEKSQPSPHTVAC